ncbi:MAG TPA: heparinase II/III family protein [Planctomycetota bacterium]|nr:heparinase II/III family protein [Planctomycetota bacterium]
MWDTLSDDERRVVEDGMRALARTIIAGDKLWTTTPNLIFSKHHRVGLVGYCLSDEDLIDWALNDPGAFGPTKGGFYRVLDSMIKDGHFWGEAPIYALHYDLHGMIALAEAARHHDGTDLCAYVSKASGGSIKNMIDGYLLMAYPLEKTGVNGGSLRLATFGDGSTGFTGLGEVLDTFLINPVSGNTGEPGLMAELEAAYVQCKDPGYAWLLSLNPNRNGLSRSVWGFVALSHGAVLPDNPTPPPAPCGIYPSQGFAMLRADETPAYWTTGALTAVMRLGTPTGHGHADYYSILLHGKGRLLYPDVNVIQYEPSYLGWTHEGIAHSTLLVDGQSPRPGQFATRSDFTPDAKFFAVSGSAFDGTHQSRALLLTKDYLVDVFRAKDDQGQSRTFDWVLHGIGRLYPGNPTAYQPSKSLIPDYWWIGNERSRTVDTAWRADFVQHGGGITPGVQAFGKEWFQQNIGVRMTMLGSLGTQVFCGDGPIADGPPHDRIDGNPEGTLPLVIARRTGPEATYCAVHEPYDQRPAIRRVHQVAETADAAAIAIDADAFSDRALIAFDAQEECSVSERRR